MRTLPTRALALLALALMVSCATARPKPTSVPESLDLSLPAVDGRTVTMADFAGKVVLVDIWATWCVPCKDSFPFYADLVRRYGADGFVVVAVSVDTEDADVSEFMADNDMPFIVVRDPKGSLPERLGLQTMPSAVLVGRDGKVAYVHAGFETDEGPEIEAQVKAALAGAPGAS